LALVIGLNGKSEFSMSLRTKMVLAFSLVVVGLIAFLVFFINQDNSRQVQNFMTRGGMFGYENVVQQLEEYYRTNGSWEGIATVADSVKPEMMGGMGMNMMNPTDNGNGNGGPSPDAGKFTIADKYLLVVWSSADVEIGSTLSSSDKANSFTLESEPGIVVGYLLVSGRHAVQSSEVSPLLKSLRTAVLRSGLIAGILAFIIAIILANGLLRPVKLLTQAADSLSHGKLSARVPVKGKDEIAHLGDSFNVMAENLEAAQTRKKAMTADIAHELRSPLAVQKAQLEAMQDGIVPINQENLQTVVDQTNFLTRLVDDLRTLALVDAGELPLDLEVLDINALCAQVVERFQPQAGQKQVKLGYVNSIDKIILVSADPDRITQILGNLISNALHHTNKDGLITLEVTKMKDIVNVSVKDDGCGIPEADLPHLFERFYKGDKSRTREKATSTGLGLSIARNLARVHGGNLVAENNKDGGANFILTLPIK
jgi:two-component system, OmpR family, sensor histidine kinase BaeS